MNTEEIEYNYPEPTRIMLRKIKEQVEEACSHFLFEPVSPNNPVHGESDICYWTFDGENMWVKPKKAVEYITLNITLKGEVNVL